MPHGFRSSFSIQPSKPSMDTAFGGPTLASIRTSITCFELSRSASADSVELMVMEDTRLFQTDPLPGLVEINLSSRVQIRKPGCHRAHEVAFRGRCFRADHRSRAALRLRRPGHRRTI